MVVKCPHCGENIEVFVAGDLNERFGLNGNHIQHAKSTGKFPKPWMSFNNRDVWLGEDVKTYVLEQRGRETETSVKTIEETEDPEIIKRAIEQLNSALERFESGG
jgi:hypothetical protein